MSSAGNPSSRESLCFFKIESSCLHRLFIYFHGSSQASSALPPLLSPFLQVLLESQLLSRRLPFLPVAPEPGPLGLSALLGCALSAVGAALSAVGS